MNATVKQILVTAGGIVLGAWLIRRLLKPRFSEKIPSGDSPLDKGN